MSVVIKSVDACLPLLLLCVVGKVGSKSKEDAPHELESQFILRLPQVSIVFPRINTCSTYFIGFHVRVILYCAVLIYVH